MKTHEAEALVSKHRESLLDLQAKHVLMTQIGTERQRRESSLILACIALALDVLAVA